MVIVESVMPVPFLKPSHDAALPPPSAELSPPGSVVAPPLPPDEPSSRTPPEEPLRAGAAELPLEPSVPGTPPVPGSPPATLPCRPATVPSTAVPPSVPPALTTSFGVEVGAAGGEHQAERARRDGRGGASDVTQGPSSGHRTSKN